MALAVSSCNLAVGRNLAATQAALSRILSATAPPNLGMGSTQVAPVDGMVQVYVPAGDFRMGSDDSDSQAFPVEKPQHPVYLDAYWIDRTDVTNAMYAQCVAAHACQAPNATSSKTRTSYYGNPPFAESQPLGARFERIWRARCARRFVGLHDAVRPRRLSLLELALLPAQRIHRYPVCPLTELATAPKSNTTNAYFKACEKVEAEGKVQVPQHLQDGTPSAGDARDLGHGEGYAYPHAEPGHHVGQQYLPTALLGTYFYSPSEQGYEAQVKDRLARWRAAQEKALGIEQTETLPELSEAEVLDVRRRTARRGEDA